MSNNADGVPLGLTSEHVNHTIDGLSLRMLESAAILPLAILTRRNGVAVPGRAEKSRILSATR